MKKWTAICIAVVIASMASCEAVSVYSRAQVNIAKHQWADHNEQEPQ